MVCGWMEKRTIVARFGSARLGWPDVLGKGRLVFREIGRSVAVRRRRRRDTWAKRVYNIVVVVVLPVLSAVHDYSPSQRTNQPPDDVFCSIPRASLPRGITRTRRVIRENRSSRKSPAKINIISRVRLANLGGPCRLPGRLSSHTEPSRQ